MWRKLLKIRAEVKNQSKYWLCKKLYCRWKIVRKDKGVDKIGVIFIFLLSFNKLWSFNFTEIFFLDKFYQIFGLMLFWSMKAFIKLKNKWKQKICSKTKLPILIIVQTNSCYI